MNKGFEDILKELPININVKVPKREVKRVKNIFYWWRRFPVHNFLHPYKPIVEKAQNGDFDYSPYWAYIQYEYYWLAEEIFELRNSNKSIDYINSQERELWTAYNRRLKHLYKDALTDEDYRMNLLIENLKLYFGGSKDDAYDYVYEHAEGTILEVINGYKLIREHARNN
jgi:hypothetical protein